MPDIISAEDMAAIQEYQRQRVARGEPPVTVCPPCTHSIPIEQEIGRAYAPFGFKNARAGEDERRKRAARRSPSSRNRYCADVHPRLAARQLLKTRVNARVAKILGVSDTTVISWRRRHEEFDRVFQMTRNELEAFLAPKE